MKAVYRYAFGFRRTVDHLKAWSVKLPPAVKRTKITFHTNSRGHSGIRKFTYQNLPQLKYHNPDVPHILVRNTKNDDDDKCAVEFLNDNDQVIEKVDSLELEAKQIQKKIEDVFSV